MTIYIVLKRQEVVVLRSNKSDTYNLNEFGAKENQLDTYVKAIFNLVSSLTFESQTKLHFLIDHPFYELKFITFPYAVKLSAVRPLIIHALGNDFLYGIDRMHFNYYTQTKEQLTHYAVYACTKEFSEKLSVLIHEKKCSLQGIYPLSHWQFLDSVKNLSQQLSKSDEELTDYIILDINDDFAKFFIFEDGLFIKYQRHTFSVKDTAKKKVAGLLKKLRLHTFDERHSGIPIYVNLRDKEISDELAGKNLFTGSIQSVPLSFNCLKNLHVEMSKLGYLVSMLRIENLVFKEVLRSLGLVKVSFALLGMSTLILMMASIIKYSNYQTKNDELAVMESQIIADYDPTIDKLADAEDKLDKSLMKAEEVWQIRSKFLYRTYGVSNYFKEVQSLVEQWPDLELSQVSWSENQKSIRGVAETDKQLSEFIEALKNKFPDFDIQQESAVINKKVNFNLRIES
ncbi:MAG: hypothetical protein JJV97_06460 [SAR324 cluster bacterium]|nr:hypothetical protein [SAR324 cluster bacterium]